MWASNIMIYWAVKFVLGLNCKINMTQVKFDMIESLWDQWPLNSVTQWQIQVTLFRHGTKIHPPRYTNWNSERAHYMCRSCQIALSLLDSLPLAYFAAVPLSLPRIIRSFHNVGNDASLTLTLVLMFVRTSLEQNKAWTNLSWKGLRCWRELQAL